jgi:glycosyltransferase involved in cell wall biosynthesis
MSRENPGDERSVSDVPVSLAEMASQARPARIIFVDIEDPLPKIEADDRYKDAWVVLCRNSVPRCVAAIDLTDGATATRDHLQELVERLEASSQFDDATSMVADAALPRISIVVPTIVERIEELGQCIEAIAQLDYPNFEVLLVDNRRVLPSEDPLPSLVDGRPWLRVISERRPGVSAARNAGVTQATGEIIAFTDDDVRVDRHWLRAIGTRMVLNPGLDALTGLILPAELETPAQVWFERYYGGFGSERTFVPVMLVAAPSRRRVLRGSTVIVRDDMGAEVNCLSLYGIGAYGAGANMAFRKSAFERIGGFDVTLGIGMPAHGGEDLAIFITVLWTGGQVGYEPSAFVHHRHRRQYTELMKQIDGYGQGFTAMLLALVRSDRRHLISIASQLPAAIKRKAVQRVERVGARSSSASPSRIVTSLYPSTLFKRELSGFFRGPLAYARSTRYWRAAGSAPRQH